MEVSREHYRAMIYYDFKSNLNEHESFSFTRLQQAFGVKAPSRATIFRWFCEFKRGRSSFGDEERNGRPPCSVTPENVARVQELINEDTRCTYVTID